MKTRHWAIIGIAVITVAGIFKGYDITEIAQLVALPSGVFIWDKVASHTKKNEGQ